MVYHNLKAQTLSEYIIVMGLVVAAVTIMSPYMKWGLQGAIKIAADELGAQKKSDRVEEIAKGGFLSGADVFSKTQLSRSYQESNSGQAKYTRSEAITQDTSVNFVEGKLSGEFASGN